MYGTSTYKLIFCRNVPIKQKMFPIIFFKFKIDIRRNYFVPIHKPKSIIRSLPKWASTGYGSSILINTYAESKRSQWEITWRFMKGVDIFSRQAHTWRQKRQKKRPAPHLASYRTYKKNYCKQKQYRYCRYFK